jgi:fatty acid CoA ligase FadD36
MPQAPVLLPALGPDAPDRPDLVRIDGRRLSTAELVAAATALAARIVGGPPVAVHATPSVETAVAVVAGLLAGVPVVPVPADSGAEERHHLLSDSGAGMLLVSPGSPLLAGVPGGVGLMTTDVTGGTGSPGAATAVGTWPEPAEDTTALILYTSGTTGRPKGVMVTRAAIAADLDALAEAWAWDADDVVVHGLPLFHVHGLVLGLLGPLRIGGRLIHTGKPLPERYGAAVDDGGTLCFGVPTVWSRVAADATAAARLRPARLLVSGSAPLPRPTFAALQAATGHVPVERYGMTETLITVSTRADGERRPGWVGLPLSGVRTRLVDDAGGAAAADGETVGALEVSGPTLLKGYLNRPDADAESLVGGWFRTGDVAVIGPDGFHRLVGRASTDLIKSGGFRIGAGEVEDALLAHPGVREAAVVGSPDDDLGQVVVAYVVADGVGADELADHVAANLSVHKRPRRVVLVDDLPRNAMGKVQKTKLG